MMIFKFGPCRENFKLKPRDEDHDVVESLARSESQYTCTKAEHRRAGAGLSPAAGGIMTRIEGQARDRDGAGCCGVQVGAS
jgi:hypothetical protein